MSKAGEPRAPYVAPRYPVEGAPAFYHVLHGAVPGHQMDFICCPPVPHGPLTKTHFAHVARLMKYMEPRDGAAFAFAVGNLSRDDVQHEPGHGGLALIFCARVEGVTDHAGRALPSYAHGLLAVDRAVDRSTLLEALLSLARRFSCDDGGGTAFYRSYVEHVREERGGVERLLAAHLAGFEDLPWPAAGAPGSDFIASGEAAPERVTVVYPEGASFRAVAGAAAALGAVLYRSNVKWTSLSDGREVEIPGGTSVRFVPESEPPRDGRGLVLRLDEIPEDDAEIAQRLFAARPRSTRGGEHQGWRERYATMSGAEGAAPGARGTAGRARSGRTRWGWMGVAAVAVASAAALVVTFAPRGDGQAPAPVGPTAVRPEEVGAPAGLPLRPPSPPPVSLSSRPEEVGAPAGLPLRPPSPPPVSLSLQPPPSSSLPPSSSPPPPPPSLPTSGAPEAEPPAGEALGTPVLPVPGTSAPPGRSKGPAKVPGGGRRHARSAAARAKAAAEPPPSATPQADTPPARAHELPAATGRSVRVLERPYHDD